MKWIITIFRGLFGWLGKTGSRTAQEAASFAIGQATSATLDPPIREFIYQINKRLPNIKPGTSELIEAWYKGKISDNELKTNLHELGYNDRAISIMKQAREALLGVGEIQTLYNRGEISESEAKKRFAQLGFSPKQQDELIKLAGYIPSVGDFIRMAVREVFTPEIAEIYGLFEDYPPELNKYARMAGLDPQYAKYYWGAHWELPSYTQGVEMYHRGIISYDELKTLLRSLDVMPYWRDKLIRLSETPFTRVDVRRMYQLGVLSFDEMVRAYMDLGYTREKAEKLAEFTAYMDLGYTREKAEKLAEFTARDASEEERSLTKTEITTLYRGNTITREEAENFLQSLGYPLEHIELILSLEDYRKGKERIDKIKNITQKRYVRGFITRNDVMATLSREGLPAKEIEDLIAVWDVEKSERVNLPTKTEIKRFLQKEIISINEYKQLLERMGYPDEVVNWYVEEIQQEIAEEEEKAKEKVEEEKEEKPILPSKTELISFLKKGVITTEEFRKFMHQKGYTEEIIDFYVQSLSEEEE